MHEINGLPVLVPSPIDSESAIEPPALPRYAEFQRIPYKDQVVSERWLQETLTAHPELLPLTELDKAFGPIRSLAREVSTGVGPIDWLGISPSGYLTVVETKLYRNPEARRAVVGQILDYCSCLAKWSYEDLVEAVREANPAMNGVDDPVVVTALGADAPLETQKRFGSAVSESMAHGRFMLMIVGDGFHESTLNLVGYIEKSMHLQFTIRLVELQLYRSSEAPAAPILVVPRLAARTREVVRSIVRIQSHVNPADIIVEAAPNTATTPSFEEFLDEIRRTSPVADDMASFVGELEGLGIYPDPTKDGISLRWADPAESGQQFRIFRARKRGNARFGVLVSQLEGRGYNTKPAFELSETVARWVDGGHVRPDSAAIVDATGKSKDVPLEVLVRDHREEFLTAIKRLLDAIKENASVAVPM